MKIRTQILLSFLGLILAPLSLLMTWQYRVQKSQLEKEADHQIRAWTESLRIIFDAEIRNKLENLRIDSQHQELSAFLVASPDGRKALRSELNVIVGEMTAYDPIHIRSVALLDRSGRNVIDSHLLWEGRDESASSGFRKAMESGALATEFSLDSKQSTYILAAPVRDGRKSVVGCVRILIDSSLFENYLDRHSSAFKPKVKASLIDAGGTLIAGTPPRHLPAESGLSWSDDDRICRLDLQELSWHVVLFQSRADYQEPILKLMNSQLQIFGAVLLLLLLSIHLVASRLSRPLQLLTEAVRQSRQGEVQHLPLEGGSELRTLAKSFNELTAQLQFSLAETRSQLRQKQAADAALALSEERLRLALECSRVGFYDLDLNTGVAVTSDYYARMLGLDPATLKESTGQWLERLHPDDLKRCDEKLRDYLAGTSPDYRVEFRQRCADGSWKWILSVGEVVSRDPAGRPLRMVGTHTDIDSLKNSEAALRQRETDLQITLNSIGEAVLATDAEGIVTRMNPVAEAICGYSLAEARGRPVTEILRLLDEHSRRPLVDPITSLLRKPGSSFPGEIILVSRDGQEILVTDCAAPIRGGEGQILGAVLVFRDVRKEHQLQERLNHAQKMDAIGQLAGGVAHDFNNMLGAILGAAELLKSQLVDRPACHRHLNMIRDAAERAADLTRKLLSFGRRSVVKSEAIRIHPLVEASSVILDRSIDRSIEIILKLEAERDTVTGDASMLQNALINLGINARDAMPKGGSLTFATRNDGVGDDAVLLIEVSDTGTGIPKEILPKIFDPFFTTKDVGKGTGLGLASVYSSVQEARGRIEVSSEPGQGTCFRICLPLAKAAADDKSNVESPSGSTRRGRILIVDDETMLAQLASDILGEAGYETRIAGDGLEAIKVYTEDPAFDLILLDMVMPRMSGHEAFAKLRDINPDIPILIASGFDRSGSIDRLLLQQHASYIGKPYKASQLCAAVEKLFRGE
ncbi:MAG: hypothetical protein RL095_1904 [Verrucomicrobiota bacterium]|jgi:PAS domain S-box-containing protein